MENLVRPILVLEILLVNLLTAHCCLKKKYSNLLTVTILTLFTLGTMALSLYIRQQTGVPYLGGGILIVIGFSFLFPLIFLYQESPGRILAVMLFSWSHTLSAGFLSRQAAAFFPAADLQKTTLLVQTMVLFLSTPFMIRFVNRRFSVIISNLPPRLNRYLLGLSSLQFLSITAILISGGNSSYGRWPAIVVVLVFLITLLSYSLIHIIVRNFINIETLEYLAYRDSLTGTENRLAFFLDCNHRIALNRPFRIVYMDLDGFKGVNDTHGHQAGDRYLQEFTRAARKAAGDTGKIYRLSGDEFACVMEQGPESTSQEELKRKICMEIRPEIPFRGVSTGTSLFPGDGHTPDELLVRADNRMYRAKRAPGEKPACRLQDSMECGGSMGDA